MSHPVIDDGAVARLGGDVAPSASPGSPATGEPPTDPTVAGPAARAAAMLPPRVRAAARRTAESVIGRVGDQATGALRAEIGQLRDEVARLSAELAATRAALEADLAVAQAELAALSRPVD